MIYTTSFVQQANLAMARNTFLNPPESPLRRLSHTQGGTLIEILKANKVDLLPEVYPVKNDLINVLAEVTVEVVKLPLKIILNLATYNPVSSVGALVGFTRVSGLLTRHSFLKISGKSPEQLSSSWKSIELNSSAFFKDLFISTPLVICLSIKGGYVESLFEFTIKTKRPEVAFLGFSALATLSAVGAVSLLVQFVNVVENSLFSLEDRLRRTKLPLVNAFSRGENLSLLMRHKFGLCDSKGDCLVLSGEGYGFNGITDGDYTFNYLRKEWELDPIVKKNWEKELSKSIYCYAFFKEIMEVGRLLDSINQEFPKKVVSYRIFSLRILSEHYKEILKDEKLPKRITDSLIRRMEKIKKSILRLDLLNKMYVKSLSYENHIFEKCGNVQTQHTLKVSASPLPYQEFELEPTSGQGYARLIERVKQLFENNGFDFEEGVFKSPKDFSAYQAFKVQAKRFFNDEAFKDYELFSLSENYSSNELRMAYKRLSSTFHPDRNTDEAKAAEVFKIISIINSGLEKQLEGPLDTYYNNEEIVMEEAGME
jgi:hypothetical protein